MRRYLFPILLSVALLGAYLMPLARAAIVCTLPFQLQNNTTADATQVMANYNALVTCFTTAAAAGVNNDITALQALTTPLTPVQGGSPVYTATANGGVFNAYTATVAPTGFSYTVGKRVQFVPGAGNTIGNTTLNVNGLGAVNVMRATVQTGIRALVGGELAAGVMTEAIYDGTQFVLQGPPVLVGQLVDFANATVATGYLAADGGCYSQSTYAALFAVIGSPFGACGGGLFATPDLRGRAAYGPDNGSGRISTCFGGVFVAGCGAQTVAFTQAMLPSATTFAVSGSVTTTATLTVGGGLSPVVPNTTSVATTVQTGAGADIYLVNKFSTPNTISGSGSISVGATAASGGLDTAVPILSPALVITKMIKL